MSVYVWLPVCKTIFISVFIVQIYFIQKRLSQNRLFWFILEPVISIIANSEATVTVVRGWNHIKAETVPDYRKTPKNSDTRKNYCNYPKIGLWGNASKWCRQNCKQCRPWSDCSCRSCLIWVYTVCSDLSVQKFRNITIELDFCSSY